MAQKQWEEQLQQFIRRTGDELKKHGEEIKREAERLVNQHLDAEKQDKVRQNLKELQRWAVKTAEEVAVVVEGAARRAETFIQTKIKPGAGAGKSARGNTSASEESDTGDEGEASGKKASRSKPSASKRATATKTAKATTGARRPAAKGKRKGDE